MRVLIVSATAMEIAPFISRATGHNHLVTGVGIPACIYNLTSHLFYNNYDLIIQAGIAGTFDEELALGSSVFVKQDLFAEAGAFENNSLLSLHELGLSSADGFPYSNGWLVNDHPLLQSSLFNKVNAITVAMVSDQLSPLHALYKNKYAPQVESMEGAAFHYVCLQKNIPFLQLRSVSNVVGERNKTKWKMQDAIGNLDDSLTKLLRAIEIN